MEFSPSTMEKLAELFRPPEPDVFQGEDFTPTGNYYHSIQKNLVEHYL